MELERAKAAKVDPDAVDDEELQQLRETALMEKQKQRYKNARRGDLVTKDHEGTKGHALYVDMEEEDTVVDKNELRKGYREQKHQKQKGKRPTKGGKREDFGE